MIPFKSTAVVALVVSFTVTPSDSLSLRIQSSHFLGNNVVSFSQDSVRNNNRMVITMRKQKASNKRTTRLQRGGRGEDNDSKTLTIENLSSLATPSSTSSWNRKSVSHASIKNASSNMNEKGRGRSRKRLQYYNSLSAYHTHFLDLITAEFLAEEEAVRQRIEVSSDNPLSLEIAGHALFDLYPERRGNIFSDEVYRLVKSFDATSSYLPVHDEQFSSHDKKKVSAKTLTSILPPNHKFSQNDVIMLTLQPGGTGDYFGRNTMPTNTDDAISVEARVVGTGPSYIDVAIPGGNFESKFGPAPNNRSESGKGDPNMRLRADRYFSKVPFNRMTSALGQLTTTETDNLEVDDSIRQAILATFDYNDPSNTVFQDAEACNLQEISKMLAKAPLKDSTKMANEVLTYLQSDHPKKLFPQFNGPQLTCIGAALTRKLTMIQGPPGTGKTTVAASVAFGFVHQCRSLSRNHKVLASAFSNCGADNLAEQLLRVGLKVVRIGKASAISPILWDFTLDAAIERDPEAKKAMEDAMIATANVNSNRSRDKKTKKKSDNANERLKRDAATRAVRASIEACNAAATKAMREADVIVCTSVGAADTRLLAACGIVSGDEDENQHSKKETTFEKEFVCAPDGGSPLKMPFVLIDEACQSVEPASLIPILSTNSCRSLVLLGDPCQLPPTVISDDASGQDESPLAISLMSRLASILPAPVVVTAKADKSPKDDYFLNMKATRQANSLIKRKNGTNETMNTSYRKKFSGSMLLSVQYRMHPSIAAFSSSVFYDGLLSTPEFLRKNRGLPSAFERALPLEKGRHSVRFIHIGGRNNEKRGDSDALPISLAIEDSATPESIISNESISNEAEATEIVKFLKKVMENNTEETSVPHFEGSIGIITPYSAQVALIKSLITEETRLTSVIREKSISIEVNSVDAFQGKECDVILFSAVRSNRRDNVGFLCDWRRMNVALTRAKSGLIVFGDMTTLKRGDKHWEGFCKWAEDLDCVFDVLASKEDNDDA